MLFHTFTFAGVQMKPFEHEAYRLSAQTSPEGPGKC